MSTKSGSPREGTFVRALGLFDATNLVVGSMIGSGIFIVSADIARTVGSSGWLLVVWGLTLFITVVAALSYGELAGMFPRAGGQYVYLREAFGPLPGFLYGWTLFLIIQSGSIAAVAMAFAKFLGVFAPEVSGSNVLLDFGEISLGGSAYGLQLTTDQVVAIGAIALLTLPNCIGVKAGKWVQNISTALKVLALLGVLGLVFFSSSPPDAALNAPGFWAATVDGRVLGGLDLLVAVGVAMVGSLFAADAWNNITFIGAEVKNPKRTIALSMAIGGGLVCLLYLVVNVAYLKVLPLAGVQNAADDRVATAAVQAVLGGMGEQLMAAAIMLSTFGCLNGMILQGPRLYYAMARDGLFFARAGHLGVKSGVPIWGVAAQSVWAGILCLSGAYGDLLDYVIFAALLFYALTVAGIFVLRRTRPGVARPYRAWGYPVVPAIYVLLCTWIMVVLLFEKPTYTWPGLLVVLSGVPVFFAWRRFGKPLPAETAEEET
jgi:APA family basic amino acid/polyamine antiporter